VQLGDILGQRYRLDELIGTGGMGDVWRARDTLLERDVAIKVLRPALSDDDRFRELMRAEATAVAGIRHPGVVDLHDYVAEEQDDGSLLTFLVMEHVDAEPLSALLHRQGRLDVAHALRIVENTAEALHHAHSCGIIHSDVKSENILVKDDDSVVLVDFGIARALHTQQAGTGGRVHGTVSYMSPEQLRNLPLDAASDVYSLGIVAHECLSGGKPFTGDEHQAVIDGHLYRKPPALPPEVPPAVAAMVERALAKEPADRFTTAAAMARECRQIGYAGQVLAPLLTGTGASMTTSQHTAASPADTAAATRSRTRERLLRLGAGCAAIAVAAALLAGQLWQPDRDSETPDREALPGVSGFDDSNDGTQATPTDATPADNDANGSPGEDAKDANDSNGSSHADPDQGSSSQPEDDDGDDDSSQPPPTPSVDVPSVLGQRRSAAEQTLSEQGFPVTVIEDGDGKHECGVSQQEPRAGSQVDAGTPVEITVRYEAKKPDCK
jgi:serine/threonine protein kinase